MRTHFTHYCINNNYALRFMLVMRGTWTALVPYCITFTRAQNLKYSTSLLETHVATAVSTRLVK